MDPSFSESDAEPSEAISGLLNEFFERRQAGENLTPERFAGEHPELAEALRPHLAGLDLIDKACTPGGDAANDDARRATRLPSVEGFKLVEEIGRGGMGVVYKALQVATKRIVALKVMLAGPFASATAGRRFEREVELAARLQHPHIIRILEAGTVAEQPYYAMDYVAGVRLDHFLSVSKYDVRATLELFVQICDAVEYAHTHGVVHRDLKPANVLVDDEGNPHVLDFGLAKATDQAESEEALTTRVSLPGQVLGTLFYLSPEQAVGATEEVDERTDVYALGLMLFEALTGSLPFDTTGRPSEIIRRLLEDSPVPPSSLSERVDAELETIILKALSKEKERRYQSARELAEDIRRYLASEPIHARRPSSLYVLRKKLRKHRWRVAVATAVLVCTLVGLLLVSRSEQRELAAARQTALRFQRELERGEDVLGQASVLCQRYPQLPEAQLTLAHAMHRRKPPYGKAVMFLEEGLERDPSLWHHRVLLAEIYREAGDLERADALVTQGKREAPDTAEAWYLRSFATLDIQRAADGARQAVRCQPLHALAWNRLAFLCMQIGDLDGAAEAADRLIELGDRSSSWTSIKGSVLARQGRYREAIQLFTRGGDYPCRAHMYRRVMEYDKAVADYTRQIEAEIEAKASADVWHFYQRATPLWMLGRGKEAVEDYRRVRLRLGRPFYSDARAFLILHELGRQQEAEQVLDAGLRDVEDPSWLRQIFRCLAGQLTPDELVADAVARRNAEHLCEAYYYAGEACLLAGQLAEAREYFEQCVRTGLGFDPDAEVGTPMNEYELAQWRLETVPLPATVTQPAASAPTSRP